VLPRRHILDVWEFNKNEDELLSMCTLSLAMDAVKYLEKESKRDHLVEALEFNEFVCYMFPHQKPLNRSLLFHVVSDLLGLLMYGVPKKTKHSLKNLESINYSEKNMEHYPIIEVWNTLKDKVYVKKHGVESIIEGFVKKIQIEMDIMERYSFVEDILSNSKEKLNEWLQSLASFYDKHKKTVKNVYDQWWALWLCKSDQEKVLSNMLERLNIQAQNEYGLSIDKNHLLSSILSNKRANRHENDNYSRWYKEGVKLLLRI